MSSEPPPPQEAMQGAVALGEGQQGVISQYGPEQAILGYALQCGKQQIIGTIFTVGIFALGIVVQTLFDQL